MTEEEKKIEEKIQPYRFWLLVTLSAFIAVTFVLYLPLRFQHQAEPVHKEETVRKEVHEVHPAQYQEEIEVREGLVVNLNVTPVPVAVGTSTRLDFFVNQKPGNIPVADLEIEHEKPMHVIGLRNDLNEFFHIHPEQIFSASSALWIEDFIQKLTPEERAKLIAATERKAEPTGFLTATYTFKLPGLYKIWSEIKRGGVNHTFGHPEVSVIGEGAREEKKVSFGRNVVTGLYQVALELDEPVVKGHEHDLSFDIHTFDGDEVEVEDYLAAKMHLTVIKDDWRQFIHTHPVSDAEQHAAVPNRVSAERNSVWNGIIPSISAHGVEEIPGKIHEDGEDKTIDFHVVFPEAGLYKLFAQFRPKGVNLPQDEALLAEFWVRVEEKAPVVAISNWWVLLAISLAFIVFLSWGVKKYLRVA